MNRVALSSVDAGGKVGTLKNNAAASPRRSMLATIHASRSRLLPRILTDAAALASDHALATHLNSSATSPALCHLWSGSLAKHFFTNLSKAGGVIGRILDIAGGSACSIAPIRLALPVPGD